MDSRRADTIASLLLLIIVVVCVVGFGRYYFVTREIDRIEMEDTQRVIGSDRSLLETVQNLENTLRDRISYQFVSKDDPLDLTRVITSQQFLEKLGADKNDPDEAVMRLSATVVGADGSAAAVIRYLGSGHVLRVGDEFEGWTVRNINRETLTLARGGETKVLENRPVRETLQSTGMMLSVRPMKNEDWLRTMYSNVGFPGDVGSTSEPQPEQEIEPAGEQPAEGEASGEQGSEQPTAEESEAGEQSSSAQSDTTRSENW